MIEYPRNRQQTIPESSVKIVGLGGAGLNMLDRVALDGIEGAELLSLNTDVRTLAGTVAGEKIQLGCNLTKGLGAGGDPELGEKAILEAEDEIRDSLRDRQIVFLCVGLGGGTGSGAAPVLVRLAREAGAFVVVFATMPFAFEGRRRRHQAEESLNQLAVLANALVTFDNGRMGELVLPKQGVHEAFSAADRMISDSITAVSRLVLRPGLINVGLDELMSALKTTRSRCLFGSGLGQGENRAQAALKAALNSPLLDRGSLLEDATTVLVHICGGEDMTLFEVELLMQGLTKFIPDDAHLLFGAATDSQMKDSLSVTVISALPEERLQMSPAAGFEKEEMGEETTMGESEENVEDDEEEVVIEMTEARDQEQEDGEEEVTDDLSEPDLEEIQGLEDEDAVGDEEENEDDLDLEVESDAEPDAGSDSDAGKIESVAREYDLEPDEFDDYVAPGLKVVPDDQPEDAAPEEEAFSKEAADADESPAARGTHDEEADEASDATEPHEKSRDETLAEELDEDGDEDEEEEEKVAASLPGRKKSHLPPRRDSADQGELLLEGAPKGRFDGESPNVGKDGEDLDIPPYLRRKRRR